MSESTVDNAGDGARALGEELASLRELVGRFEAQKEYLTDRRGALETMASAAKGRLALQPKIAAFLEKFQALSHRRAVGVYEELLTVLLNEVLPGSRLARLSLGTERQLPSLDIEIEKDGHLESIMDGSGGAVTNVMSVGLRAIALARSGNFPFLALDEPDCWLKPTRIEKFASILSQVAGQLGMQMLLVSHHDTACFKSMSKLNLLTRRGGRIECDVLADAQEPWEPGRRYISGLILNDFMSHQRTAIPLGPGVTTLTGENDIGKSAVMAALRAVFYGECSDSFVRHGTSRCQVVVEFSDGHSLVFEHHLKNSPKRTWSYCHKDLPEPMFAGTAKTGVPDWLADVCNIARTEGLDVQLANQKSPVFLLDQPGSKRAGILSIGRETSHLQKMTATNKQNAAADALLAKESEKEAESIRRKLTLLARLEEIKPRLEEARAGLAKAEGESLKTAAVQKKAERLALLAEAESAASAAQARLPNLAAPKLAAAKSWAAAVGRAKAIEALPELESVGLPPPPRVGEVGSWASKAKRYCRGKSISTAGVPEALPQAPELSSVKPAALALRRLAARSGLEALGSAADIKTPTPPCLAGVDVWRGKGSELWRRGRLEAFAARFEGSRLPAAPKIEAASPWIRKADRFGTLATVADSEVGSCLPAPPSLAAVRLGWARADKLRRTEADGVRIEGESKAALDRLGETRARVETVLDALGGGCPLCGSPVSSEHFMGKHR